MMFSIKKKTQFVEDNGRQYSFLLVDVKEIVVIQSALVFAIEL
jgi:hypothetical protein